uniref:Protein draper-like isoform X2 n=1 Tax=Crassostrea virginica TaxID=6565 RepID=A0A8B8B2E8_CRAVI|nr:protein draper-like isoform X2 [Crassostrea virginica]
MILIYPISSISLPNIALGKAAYQSSTYSSLTGAEKAVDGLKSNLSYNGGQCAVSGSREKTALWRVDLGDISTIQNITIYYMTENQAWGCQQGFYGVNCTSTCPDNCVSDLCELVTGSCFQCAVGYRGPRCDIECDGGMYGQDCSNTCGSCLNSRQCHHINGSCQQGCGPGYQGDKCTEECNGGTYGQDCGYACGLCINSRQCHHINGSCLQGCGSGYQGDKCTEVTSLSAKQQSCENSIYISAGVSAIIVIVGTILNLLIWKRKHHMLKNSSKNITNSHVLDKQDKNIPSTYAELGDVDKQHTYDNIHHYSEANYSK